MNDFGYADPTTLRGQLQRGRGLGARRAQNAPGKAAELVYVCVVVDSRWDQQTESRDAYLARLIHRLDLPLAPIEQHLFGYDGADSEPVESALEVLALLPFVGRLDAVPVLRRYAAEGRHGPQAREAIELSGARKIPGIWDGFDEEATTDVDAARIGPPVRRSVRESCDRLSSAELIRRVGGGGAGGVPGPERRSALEELGRRADPVVLDLAEDVSLRNAAGGIPGMPMALRHLGPAAVDRARAWAVGGDGPLEDLAVEVLAEFGDQGDGVHLLEALTRAAAAAEWCATESPARGLGRLRVAEATEALLRVWEATPHSSAREAILAGLRGCAPEAAIDQVVEALDDCEPGVQRAAATVAPETPYVRARLRELCEDPLTPQVHRAARQRLARFASLPG